MFSGCERSLTRGSSMNSGDRGMLFTLNYIDPDYRVAVAFVFPNSIDVFATYDGRGGDYLSNHDGLWKVERIIRFEDKTQNDIDISFSFNARTSGFDFRGQSHVLEINEFAVVRFDEEGRYEIDILPLSDEVTGRLLKEMGASFSAEAEPTKKKPG